MYKIFIVEDDKDIAKGIAKQLNVWKYETAIVKDFSNVIQEFNEYKPDLVLMDIGLPFFDGYYWCNEIRKESSIPIIFISSAVDNMNIVMAINLGADDFVCKPFDIQILVAKIQALLRRTYNYNSENDNLEYKGLLLNTNNSSIHFNDNEVELTKNEFRILLTLMQNKGKIVSREKLMNTLWKTDVYIDENTLTVNVNRLRKKIEQLGIENYIETKFGVGYIIE